jgi:O-methyltransferase involved in polyketide biosynthesis
MNKKLDDLSGVAETLLFPVYVRALETQRPDALLMDEDAAALMTRYGSSFDRIKQVYMDAEDQAGIILRNREFDRHAADFIKRCPDGVVVHIGCGLDTRYRRVCSGNVEWYDLDLPEVIELRRQVFGESEPGHHLLGCSAFDFAWADSVAQLRPRPFLFLAEGVFMYFREEQIRALVQMLAQRFPGAELVFDTFSPLMVKLNNLRMAVGRMAVRYYWGLDNPGELEAWSPGIHLLDAWHPFDRFEPRLVKAYWMRRIPFLGRVFGVYHYRLGEHGS